MKTVLNYLRCFSIDTLKVDRSFIEDFDKNPQHEQIVAMTHAMNLRAVSEGVETHDKLRVVSDNNSDLI